MTRATATDNRADTAQSMTLEQVDHALDALTEALPRAESRWAPWLQGAHPSLRASARNLVHYWAMRQRDLHDLQQSLADYGLSSLGRSEPHVAASLTAVHALVKVLRSQMRPADVLPAHSAGSAIIRSRAVDLLGPEPPGRPTRIMVTLPSEAAEDPSVTYRLVGRGMDLARINCAHDDPEAWTRMARHVRDAAQAQGRDCRVAMDLPGPKLRTGPLTPGPAVLRLHPSRDAVGRVTAPARVRLVPAGPGEPSDGTGVPMPRDWLDRRRDGEQLVLRDARGARRRLHIQRSPDGLVATTDQTTYLTPGTLLHPGDDAPAAVGPLPATEHTLLLRPDDLLTLTRDCRPIDPTSQPARIGCTLPEAFDHVRPGQQVHFDDGRLSGVVEEAEPERIIVRITHADPHGARLHAGRGINLPDTDLPIPALTTNDRAALTTVVGIADLVGLSFVRSPTDIDDLLRELDSRGDQRIGVLIKIETAAAFRHLPELLLTAMRRPHVGVMIARGDLAVECGYERLAELQEEILWICEAAHLPVVWATQVLEQLAKTGRPTRAEITDAAMSDRAECVMLNKGPFIDDAVTVLDDVLHRMRRHQYKKIPLLHPLTSWQRDPTNPPTAP